MIVVVPPQAAARVPVSNVSADMVPPKGISMWVWTSMPPGMTYLPVASISLSATMPAAAAPRARTARRWSRRRPARPWARPPVGRDDGAVADQDGHGCPPRSPASRDLFDCRFDDVEPLVRPRPR